MGKNIIINSELFGKGPEELGAKVMGSFLRKLCNEENKPEKIIFYNTGVKLMGEGSPVLDALELLEKGGVDLVACGTCVSSIRSGSSPSTASWAARTMPIPKGNRTPSTNGSSSPVRAFAA